jgi:RsiW-degrading membrane proteinase PrsW (M82 family)
MDDDIGEKDSLSIEERLKNLESTLNDTTEYVIDKSPISNNESVSYYPYLVAGVIPLLVGLLLYFIKPKLLTNKSKKISWKKLIGVVVISLLLSLGITYGVLNYQQL